MAAFAIGLVAIAQPAAVGAQASKPGLWEIRQQVQGDPAQQKQMDEMRKQMAAMPEAQRKQVEQMMGKHGAGMDPASGGTVARICLTKEDAARDGVPVDKRADCSYEPQRSGNTTRLKYVCTKPPSQGEVELTALSPERYTMKMKGSDDKGRAMAMQGEGRWLGADCGDVKPLKAPAKP
ncbi:DUF3617 domain-containing protein [uncultured Methylibium sp.]|uniref:DUF3617 domain-containing protein n=1 Tax=uncultured Methylibium sp. TaxID=381093 RepID=UPI0025E8F4FE|nr:DUF3617 domain-containing protein [uncultured Methylibium sp.]